VNDLSRIGVAIESDLLERFDQLIETRGYPSRSEAFRDLIRESLAAASEPDDADTVVGTVTLIYSHSVRQLSDRMTSLQHDHHHNVITSLHVHLDHDRCLEVIVLRGRAGEVRALADGLIAMKGVEHGKLTLTAPTCHSG